LSITSDLIRGHTETIILAHLCAKESYGYEINKSIQEKSGGLYELKEATLYSAFRRLEESGAIHSYWGDETTGARRRYYRVTDRGRQLFRHSVDEWHSAKTLIDTLIKEREQAHE
jgi:DNA-binding PadR family transcriptional regulator